MAQNVSQEAGHTDWLGRRFPADVLNDLSDEQRAALRRATGEQGWSRHAVDIRLTIPLPGRRYYLTVVGGEERRNRARRRDDRRRYPLHRPANIAFFMALAAVFYGVAVAILLAWRSFV